MYKRIYTAYMNLSKGDQADLKRCNLRKLADSPAYFRVLKFSGTKDNSQTQRILFLLVSIAITDEAESDSVAVALLNAGVKETQIIQITRSGDNAIEYLKRQLIRCKNVSLSSLGKLAQYWGEQARRDLLKEFILSEQEK
ncbi:type I-E CRISPR-associated protein Cse2/CasB [Shewanella psychromarinicola]|uniref:Type I-E CRISPR-associated protein Cse2/CasB n=1 Tax=Shewanella psychromarinicola TaxID=2487742 RepID=A0A3N4E9K1_9GAMM|nr:type I-E CRISPR-associated protein Cse2/CasB [Shewanella psychromarinicola]AZG36907.1 type I-E CRISPR-associated protein Cse2/CasB [Shewanella psychromarinicola]MCL1082522.1 type I-E CRISPR-associated protein Cse2/CasB [Shewanella psychromarinicola]RPA34763.1 type I-E CRISPR-associated protein Cse2/CasB [Shewanella psychromarinicola]